MKNLRKRLGDVSHSFELLTESAVFPMVQNAVEKEDKDLLVKACKKAKIPEIHISTIVSTLLSIGPQQPKWPPTL